jgi:SAM-dependent methyltransferase
MQDQDYIKSQVEGHRKTEIYALTNPGYIRLMKHLHTKIPEAGFILEIGCNTGYECVMIQNQSRQVMGIDIGEDFVVKALDLGIEAAVMDMHEMNFKDGIFDCVYMNNTLEHAHTPAKVLSEIFRVLKKGGTIVICVPADYKNRDYISTQNWDPALHLWKPTPEEFKRTVTDAGFEITEYEEIDSESMFGLENKASYNHYMVIVCKK